MTKDPLRPSRLGGEPRLRRALDSLLDLLFPPRCAGCGRSGSLFCGACLPQVEWLRGPLCPRCGEPLGLGGLCPRRRRHPVALDGLRSAAWHTGPLRKAIHRFKYSGVRALEGPLGALLLAAWRREPLPAELLVPVPLYAQRLRERGYNQAAILATRLGRGVGLPCDARSLRRTRHTAPQVGLRADERQQNVQGAFSYTGPPLLGKAVCLVDDICTTGATLEACAVALKAAGARSVWALTLARPHWGEEALSTA